MPLVEIERSELGQVTVVNPDQITFLRHDSYGTAIHFSSGEHIICDTDMESLIVHLNRLSPEQLLIKAG